MASSAKRGAETFRSQRTFEGLKRDFHVQERPFYRSSQRTFEGLKRGGPGEEAWRGASSSQRTFEGLKLLLKNVDDFVNISSQRTFEGLKL